MGQKISASVGKGGKNQPNDVKAIQTLLNPFAGDAGFSKLKPDGKPSGKLDKAISSFQENICGFRPDGRVDPGKRTIKKLLAGPAKAKAEKKKEEKEIQKVKSQEHQKALAAAKKSLEKAAKTQKVSSTVWGAMWESIAKEAEALYDSYWASGEKKGDLGSPDEAKKQAKKISDKMNKEIKKKIDSSIKEADTGGNTYPGKVTGKTQGVKKELIEVLLAVSSHYEGTPIVVVSGLRDKRGQARAMFKYWDKHLKKYGKNGDIYWFVRQPKYQELWKELDDLKMVKKDLSGFVKCMLEKAPWGSVSRHLSGEAVDISTSTDKKIIKALSMVMNYLPEKDGNSEGIKCHHFDNKTKIKFPITDSMRSKFPK
ncbi:peptidoglycan-binding domain-containing protein [Leisingera sp. ANG-Vp]|uniref:peptidoglycan-binding domain-containing protein n=1 Tax=Leisingera sp. ANG-Vp TaxID=1577896 RepID=UPI00057DD9B8|nr:peptidoglycan-binding domain-containing protein [Leisingera sp. ANG-Vp]KIC21629.1 hypothetical protein RA20_03150 [Leisingera sp. ANG-Vp]